MNKTNRLLTRMLVAHNATANVTNQSSKVGALKMALRRLKKYDPFNKSKANEQTLKILVKAVGVNKTKYSNGSKTKEFARKMVVMKKQKNESKVKVERLRKKIHNRTGNVSKRKM